MNKKLKLLLMFLGLEIAFYFSVLIDTYLINKFNSVLFNYLEESIIGFTFLGTLFFFIFVLSKNIMKSEIKRGLIISIIMLMIPWIFLFFILSQLH
jgi:hypothetical protein